MVWCALYRMHLVATTTEKQRCDNTNRATHRAEGFDFDMILVFVNGEEGLWKYSSFIARNPAFH